MATSKSKSRSPKSYVAVVISRPMLGSELFDIQVSGRPLGDWACFVGASRDEVIRRAREARRAWQGTPGQYEIHVGVLDAKVRVPEPAYELVPLR